MSGTITSRPNSKGGATVSITDGRAGAEIALSRMTALQHVSAVLRQLSLTSLVNNPDGTFTAR